MTRSKPISLESNLKLAQSFLKHKLIAQKTLKGFENEEIQLFNVLTRTVQKGESDSVLVLGPAGCGKTTLVKECLKDLEKKEGAESFVLIELNGLLHVDDNLALREIISQLHLEELEGDRISGSFADNLTFLLQSLNSGGKDVSTPIIFVLEEFQTFCTHRNQTLLYNLFDVAQSAQVLLICKLKGEHPFLTEKDFEEAFSFYRSDSKVNLLKDLSILEISLVIAMSHHSEIFDGEPFNFEMIINRYLKFANRNCSVHITQREIILKAFERIKNLEVVLAVGGGRSLVNKEFQLFSLVVTRGQLQAALAAFPTLPTDLSHWASTNLT